MLTHYILPELESHGQGTDLCQLVHFMFHIFILKNHKQIHTYAEVLWVAGSSQTAAAAHFKGSGGDLWGTA